MKTLILLITMLATAAFAQQQSPAYQTVPCSGFLAGTETSQFVGGVIVLDGTTSGSSSVGTFTYTYHAELDPVHLTAVESGLITFANGDTVTVEGFGLAENSGLSKDSGALVSTTELLHFTSGSGRFARGLGGVVVQRTQSIAAADYVVQSDVYGSFKGYYVAGDPRGAQPGGAASPASETDMNPDDMVILVCDNGRERAVPDYQLDRYLKKHPGSYVGRCADVSTKSR